MVAWGPIIGAGISAIGSLFGGSKDEKTTTTIDYKAMAKAAEKAGFNPLTAIRNGGSAGFTTTHHPGLSGMDRFGAAFQTLGNALMSFDARADERAELENKLLTVQLDRLQRTPLEGQRFSLSVPQASGSTVSTKAATGGAGGGYGPGGMVLTAGKATRLAAPYIDEYGQPLPGPSPDAPDVEQILTAPALRLQKKYLEGWEKLYGPNSPAYSQRTWDRIKDWAGTAPPIPAIPQLIPPIGAGRGRNTYTPPAKKKPAPFSPFWGK